jgi:succinylglutamate desuccinylase
MDRIIGRYTGKEYGPLIVCIGGIHGNETAGIKALDLVIKMLEVEPIVNPDFTFRGRIVAIRGNLPAIAAGKRYIDKDLNRNFIKSRIDKIRDGILEPRYTEDLEAIKLINTIKAEIKDYHAQKVVIIDLHTTSSPGGIFTIVPEDKESLRIAREMHAPVIKGMIKGIRGTTMHYFNSDNMGIICKTVTFESGQHEDPKAITIAIAAIVACLRAMVCVDGQDVENQHDNILINFSEKLPSVTELIMKHTIHPGDGFEMKPNYLNFQKVKKGEIIAKDHNGPIQVPEDGILLMPLYQDQGEDGFFIIKSISEYEFHK